MVQDRRGAAVIRDSAELSAGALSAAVCVIGSGAAGMTVALELDGAGFDVLLLEAGGLKLDLASSNEIYGGKADSPHPDTSEFRRVVFGGTTGTWGGRCIPFDPIDFEPREYVPGSGWPISYQEVAEFYPRALEYCDAGAFDFTIAALRAGAALPTLPGFDGNDMLLADRIERYSLPTNFGTRYRQRIAASANVTAVLNARCVKLNRGAAGSKIESVTIADRGGVQREVRAGTFVLALGGIETARLLLASDPEGPGIGNHSDHLGRYYACHFENTLGRLTVNRGEVAFDFEKTTEGVYCRRKLQFTADAQREQQLLNCAFRLHFPSYSDAAHGSPVLSAIYLAKSALIREYQAILQHGNETAVQSPVSAHVRNVLLGPAGLARFSYQWLFLRQLATRKLPYTLIKNRDGSYPLEFNSEQIPQAGNRITLMAERDSQGVPRTQVTWGLCEADIESAKRAFLLLRKLVGEHSDCRVEIDDAALLPAIRRSVPLGGHHMGTCRMAATSQDGVVDGNCAMFEQPNVFIASSAVFRTNSYANPTLTIVALAVRLAGHLKQRLRAPAL